MSLPHVPSMTMCLSGVRALEVTFYTNSCIDCPRLPSCGTHPTENANLNNMMRTFIDDECAFGQLQLLQRRTVQEDLSLSLSKQIDNNSSVFFAVLVIALLSDKHELCCCFARFQLSWWHLYLKPLTDFLTLIT